jgi:hypothetical protein
VHDDRHIVEQRITRSLADVARPRLTRVYGGTTTTVRLSLLRAPHSPDPQADRGRHAFSYGLVAGAGVGVRLRRA